MSPRHSLAAHRRMIENRGHYDRSLSKGSFLNVIVGVHVRVVRMDVVVRVIVNRLKARQALLAER